MAAPDPALQQLARALELLRQHRIEATVPDADLLAQHPDLRHLLEPLLADAEEATEAQGLATLGDYHLLRELGRGGMGVVYEAVQRSLGRRVALKVLPDHRAHSPVALVRFRREAELLARLQHPHLVPVFASGEAEGHHYFAMELVDGCSLATLLTTLRGNQPASLDGTALAQALGTAMRDAGAGQAIVGRSHAEAVLKCLLPIAEALVQAHAAGVVHRDVKPANILLRRAGTPLLADFGLARDLEAPGVTRTGDFAGTPHYMAPEQIEAQSATVDGRLDVFALGATLYELLTLRRAFDGPSTEAVIARVLRSDPAAPQSLGLRLPDDLLAVLDKALQKSPAERYPTMAAFAQDLRALLELRPVSVQHPGVYTRLRRYARREPLRALLTAVLAIGVPAVLGLGGYLAFQQPRIAAAAARERREAAEVQLEAGYLELGEGSARLAVERFQSADRLLPGLAETTVGLVLALESLGQHEAAKAMRERLTGPHEPLRKELFGLRADEVVPETIGGPRRPPTITARPIDALGCYVRGMRWLGFAHHGHDLSAYQNAAAALREAIDRAPVARALYHCQYLHALYHLQEPAATVAFAEVVQSQWPDSPIVRYWVAFALEETQPQRALALQQLVLAARPDLALAHASIARIHEAAGRFDDAIASFRTLLALTPGEPIALGGLARALGNADRPAEALTVADEAIAAAPFSHMTHLARAEALLGLGRDDEALASVQQAVQLTERDPECYLLLARVQLARGEAAAAVPAAQQAARLAPTDSEPHLLLASAFVTQARPADAARSLEEVVRLQPERALAWQDLAFQRDAAGDAAGAEAAMQQALVCGGDQAAVQQTMGRWRQQHGDLSAAEGHYLRAIELDPTTGTARVQLAALRWTQGDMAACIRLYQEAVQAEPELGAASDGLAQALTKEGRIAEAIAERQRWASAHPDQVVPWLQLAATLLRQKPVADVEAALAAVERANALCTQPRADVLFWRADVLRVRGDGAEVCLPLYEQARERPDCSPELRQRIAARLQLLAR